MPLQPNALLLLAELGRNPASSFSHERIMELLQISAPQYTNGSTIPRHVTELVDAGFATFQRHNAHNYSLNLSDLGRIKHQTLMMLLNNTLSTEH